MIFARQNISDGVTGRAPRQVWRVNCLQNRGKAPGRLLLGARLTRSFSPSPSICCHLVSRNKETVQRDSMFGNVQRQTTSFSVLSYSIFSTRIFRIIDNFLWNLYFAWHFLFVYTDSWFIFLFRAANDLFYIYIKLDFRDGQISNHHVQLFPMVTKHRSNNAMFAMYRSRLYQTLSTHFERCEG